MIQFAEVFADEKIVVSLIRQLSWTHFIALIPLKDPLKRDFYAEMCRLERWSVRTLRAKIDSQLFERTALSRKPEELIRIELDALRDEDRLTPDLVFRDPYRPEVKATLSMGMDDADGAVEPAPPGGGGGGIEPEIDKLSNIIKAFNDLFGNIDWKDGDKIRKVIAEEIPARVAQDKAYQNAVQHSDKQNARMEHDKALNRVILELLSDHTELFKQFSDNANFKRWLTDTVFDVTYRPGMMPPKPPPQMGAM